MIDGDRFCTDPSYQPLDSSHTARTAKGTPRTCRDKPSVGRNMQAGDNERTQSQNMENSSYEYPYDHKRQDGRPTTTRSRAKTSPRNTWLDYGLNAIGLSRSHQTSVKAALLSVEIECQELSREIKKHNLEKLELRETIEACKQHVYRLQADLRASEAEVKEVKRQEQQKYEARTTTYINMANERIEKAEKEYAHCIENARKQGAQHAANANQANQKVAILRKECERLQLSNQNLDQREASLRNVEAEHWAPLSVSDIDRKLKVILSDVKQWSVKYATMSLQDMKTSPRFHLIGFRLQDDGCTPSTQDLLQRLEKNKSMSKKPSKAAALLSAAIVSSVIMRRMIKDPFFAFVGLGGDGTLQRNDAAGLDHILSQLLSKDEAGAHAWRCQLFRLLDPPDGSEGKAAEDAKAVADKSRHQAAHHWAETILTEAADVLIPSANCQAALPGLEAILLHAAELSWMFLSRKQSVTVRDVNFLNVDRALCYNHKAADLETHPLHLPEVDDEPDALDGRKIVLLCSPAVVAYGTADGTNYDKGKVWRKGVVWLG